MYIRKLGLFKMIQLAILCILTVICTCLLFNADIKHYIFTTLAATILFFVVWIVLIVSFVFLLLDFSAISNLKLNYHNLYEVAYSDPVSGIPNRFSCDVMIEKYADIELPENVGCVVIDLSNLPSVNTKFSHKAGNRLLIEFSNLLSSSSAALCFVGRNGGNKFLAVFEEGTQENVNEFLCRLKERVDKHNESSDVLPIEYAYGCALNRDEHLSQITRLVALANSRVYE